MRRLILPLLFAVLFLAGNVNETGAQTRAARPPDPVDTLLRDARLALREGRTIEIIPRLEEMLQDHPGDMRIIFVLGPAYLRVSNFEEAAVLYQGEIDRSGGRSIELWIRLADVYRMSRSADELINTLLTGLKQTPGWLPRFSDMVEIAVKDPAMKETAFNLLKQRADEPDAPLVWREVLAHACLVTGDFTEAIRTEMTIVRERRSSGNSLLRQAKVLSSRGFREAALAAFDSVLVVSTVKSIREAALHEKAIALEALGRFNQAIEAYQRQVELFPGGKLALRADFNRANLMKNTQGNLTDSREIFDSILTQTEERGGRRPLNDEEQIFREEAMLALGECALYLQAFEEAESTFVSIERESRQDKSREHAAYERAETLFYQGRFADAEESFYLLTDHYPNGEWVNDALERVLLLGEYISQAPKTLNDYARVQLLRRIGAPDSAIVVCETALADTIRSVMGDYLAVELIQLSGKAGNWTRADEMLDWLLEYFPASRLAPGMLLWMAEEAENDPARSELAAELYEETITRYPSSLAARGARVRLRAILAREENS